MRTLLRQLHLILTLQCHKASELISESFERKLQRHERIALKFHQFSCWSCRQFEKQLRFMRTALQKLERDQREALASGEKLSAAVKDRLKQLRPPSLPGNPPVEER